MMKIIGYALAVIVGLLAILIACCGYILHKDAKGFDKTKNFGRKEGRKD